MWFLHDEPYPDDKKIMEAVEDELRVCLGLAGAMALFDCFLIGYSGEVALNILMFILLQLPYRGAFIVWPVES
jgi:hypothetical protein